MPVAERLGNEVIEFVNVTKSFGDRCLIDNFSFKVPPGAIVGVIGPNGAGKSRCLLITGKEQPDTGNVKIGLTVNLAMVDQSRDVLPNDKTVWKRFPMAWISSTSASSRCSRVPTPGRFNFKGGDQQKLVGNLSGGERGACICTTLAQGRQRVAARRTFNDLDVETLRALEDALQNSPVRSWSFRTTAGSLIASPRTSWPVKAILNGCSTMAITTNTKPTRSAAWVKKAPRRIASVTKALK